MEQNKKTNTEKILAVVLVILLLFIATGAALFIHTAKKNRQAPQTPQHQTQQHQTQPAQQESSAQPTASSSLQTQPAPPANQPVSPTQPKSSAIALPLGLEIPACTKTDDRQIRKFSYYTICYRESYEEAEWSAYELDKNELVKNTQRSNDFRPDPEIKTQSAQLEDYRGSGYDRGHLAPAADFSFRAQAMSETFYMSNMTPQAPGFNRGIWKNLEEEVRVWAEKFGRVYVVCGPVLDAGAESFATIGKNKVVIPRYFYKAILAPVYKDSNDAATPGDAEKIIAVCFIIPNESCADTFWNYAVSVDDAESRTKIDFFPALEDTAESEVESSFKKSDW